MVHLEADAATGWAGMVARLIRVARPGALYPDAAAVLQLVEFLGRAAPKKAAAEVTLNVLSGLPTVGSLEKLLAMREVAAAYLRDHRAKPTRGQGWSTTLAASALPPLIATDARLVSKGGGARRFLVVHDRWVGRAGCPVRFTFHLSDALGRHLDLDRADQAQVKPAFHAELEVACAENAEAALLHLGALPGVAVGEVVMGQLGPFEAPRLIRGLQTPLTPFLDAHASGVLHLVLERAAADVAADVSLDPFVPLDVTPALLERRVSRGYRVSRERRLCCPPELHRPLQDHLRSLGASLIIRSK